MAVKKQSVIKIDLGKKAKSEENRELLKKVFSKEKIRLLRCVKNEKPNSIYSLSKLLKRDFRVVYDDVKFFESVGILELKSKKGDIKRSLEPKVVSEEFFISIKI